jgi:hypothetical protein
MLGVFAEFETNLRRERQLEGIAKAKPAGVYKDRPASIDATQVRAMKAQGLGGIGNRLTRIVGQSARLRTRSRAKFTARWAHHSAASNAFGAGGRPHRAGQRRAALHAAMGNVLKIVRCDAVGEWRWIDGRDRHPVPAMWTGKEETWQVQRGAV